MPQPQGMQAFMFYIDDWRSSWSVQAMDDSEKVAYITLLMYAASEPDCGIPDNDMDLAVLSGLGLRWWKPTRDRNKRMGSMVQAPDGTMKVKFRTCGEKIRECFSFRPNTEQSPDGRLYNERLYKEFERHQRVKTERSKVGSLGGRPTKGENVKSNSFFLTPENTPSEKANGNQPSPSTSTTSSETLSTGGEAAATYQPGEEAAAAPPQGTETSQTQPARSVSPAEIERLGMRCIEIGLPAPDDRTAIQILQLHPTVAPEQFPYFPSQRSSALYLKKSQRDVLLEITRAEHPELSRKPTASEAQNERLTAWARSEDAKRRQS